MKCVVCGKEFERVPSEIKEKNYCSKKCVYKFMSQYMQRFKHTEESKKKMSKLKIGKNNPQFEKYGKLNNNWNRVEVTCNYCKKRFMRAKEHSKRGKYNFCDYDCYADWLTTDENPYRTATTKCYGRGWAKIVRDIQKRDGYKCQQCGNTKEQKQLHVHHIIPYDICKCHSYDNLITLCANCHGKQQQIDWGYRELYRTLKINI